MIPLPVPVSHKKVPFRFLFLKNLCIPAGTNSYSDPWTTLATYLSGPPFLGSLGFLRFCGRSRKILSVLKKSTTRRGSTFLGSCKPGLLNCNQDWSNWKSSLLAKTQKKFRAGLITEKKKKTIPAGCLSD